MSHGHGMPIADRSLGGTRPREIPELTVDSGTWTVRACAPRMPLLTVTRGQPRSRVSLPHPSPQISFTLVSTLITTRPSKLELTSG
jgi:hypothetical protein